MLVPAKLANIDERSCAPITDAVVNLKKDVLWQIRKIKDETSYLSLSGWIHTGTYGAMLTYEISLLSCALYNERTIQTMQEASQIFLQQCTGKDSYRALISTIESFQQTCSEYITTQNTVRRQKEDIVRLREEIEEYKTENQRLTILVTKQRQELDYYKRLYRTSQELDIRTLAVFNRMNRRNTKTTLFQPYPPSPKVEELTDSQETKSDSNTTHALTKKYKEITI